MPALTISTVYLSTDPARPNQLQINGHGLSTGAGPAATRNIGGALPAPLAPMTDYWVNVVDADHVRLATSSANANAGTVIALTSFGSGTHLLEYGIPYRRARTYGAGAQLQSVDLNAKMDSLSALHGLLTGQAQSIWTDHRVDALNAYVDRGRVLPLENHPNFAASNVSFSTASGFIEASAAPWHWHSRESPCWGLRAGELLTSITVRMAGIGPSAVRTCRLFRMRGTTASFAEIDTFTFTGSLGSGVEAFSHALAAAREIAAADRFMIKVEGGNATDKLYGVSVGIDGIL